uniref:Uncharacterized protein n=1 Tax=Cucumis melo TaxID=3656 RepID=A0A9I9ELT7_CUCME
MLCMTSYDVIDEMSLHAMCRVYVSFLLESYPHGCPSGSPLLRHRHDGETRRGRSHL